MILRVGQFCCDTKAGCADITGPKPYLESRFDSVMAGIYAGTNELYNYGSRRSGHPVLAVLIALNEDFNAWCGEQTLINSLERRS